uniref:Uncharacterized protein n=1 Tax=Romanomermis culicivorax TaxID=13658 RepID=A0A915KEW6_ROMCU
MFKIVLIVNDVQSTEGAGAENMFGAHIRIKKEVIIVFDEFNGRDLRLSKAVSLLKGHFVKLGEVETRQEIHPEWRGNVGTWTAQLLNSIINDSKVFIVYDKSAFDSLIFNFLIKHTYRCLDAYSGTQI